MNTIITIIGLCALAAVIQAAIYNGKKSGASNLDIAKNVVLALFFPLRWLYLAGKKLITSLSGSVKQSTTTTTTTTIKA